MRYPVERVTWATMIAIQQAGYGAIQLQSVATVARPVLVTPAHDGTQRLFIVEQSGFIRVLQPGSSTPTEFLDVHTLITSAGNEQGLLGLAFHPKYAVNRRFFIYYTRSGDAALQISEFKASLADPNIADPTEAVLLTIPHSSNDNHNGGNMAFGPDGYLYAGTGDGGSGNDPPNNAQNVNVLLGKFLRLDVDSPNGAIPYSSPPTNPFFGSTAGADEIYAIGMRNPWRWSFDRGGTHQLYCGDVGQDAWEEIDIIELGRNYGWRVFEGMHCTGNGPASCTQVPSPYTPPIGEYGQTSSRCSITGGYVYRGYQSTFPTGAYLYADYCSGEIFQLNPAASGGAQTLQLDTTNQITSFGQDEAGELYICARSGTIYRIASVPAPAACGYSIAAPTTVNVGSGGVTGSFTLNTGAACGWTAASHAAWITVNVAPNFGAGTTSIGYTVAANTGSSRSGAITVAGQTFAINQDAALSVTSWRSVRSHGSNGSLSIPLDSAATGNGLVGPAVESRLGGLQRIEIDFSAAVSLVDGGKISIIGYNANNPGGLSFSPSGVAAVDADTLAIAFPATPAAGALPDMTCYVVSLLPGLLSQDVAGDVDVRIRSLVGDMTADGAVSLSDAIFTRIVSLAGGTAINFVRHDLDTSGGAIDDSDVLGVKPFITRPPHAVVCP